MGWEGLIYKMIIPPYSECSTIYPSHNTILHKRISITLDNPKSEKLIVMKYYWTFVYANLRSTYTTLPILSTLCRKITHTHTHWHAHTHTHIYICLYLDSHPFHIYHLSILNIFLTNLLFFKCTVIYWVFWLLLMWNVIKWYLCRMELWYVMQTGVINL